MLLCVSDTNSCSPIIHRTDLVDTDLNDEKNAIPSSPGPSTGNRGRTESECSDKYVLFHKITRNIFQYLIYNNFVILIDQVLVSFCLEHLAVHRKL